MPLLELNIVLSSLPQRLQQSPLLLHIPDTPFLSQDAMQPSHVVSLSLLDQFTSEQGQESPQPLRRPSLSSSVLGSPNALVSPEESSFPSRIFNMTAPFCWVSPVKITLLVGLIDFT